MMILRPNGTPDRIVEWLTHDGGWYTVDALALILHTNPKTITRALHRLRHAGAVKSRMRLGNYNDDRLEWATQ